MLKQFSKLLKVTPRFYTPMWYTQDHEWINDENGYCGISDHAQDAMGEVIHFEFLVEVGETVEAGQTYGEIESVKSVSECYCPAGGVVAEINEVVMDDDSVGIINEDAEGNGWMIKIDDFTIDGLMDADEYAIFEAEDH